MGMRDRLRLAMLGLAVTVLTTMLAMPMRVHAQAPTIVDHVFPGKAWPAALAALPGGDVVVAEQVTVDGTTRGRLRRIGRDSQPVWTRELEGKRLFPFVSLNLIGGRILSLVAMEARAVIETKAVHRDWIAMLSTSGEVLLERAFAGPLAQAERHTVRLADGRYAAIGTGKHAPRLVLLSADGAVQAEHAVETKIDSAYAIAAYPDGGFVAAWVGPDEKRDVARGVPEVARYDRTGSRMWITSLAAVGEEHDVSAIAVLSDGRLAVAGGASGLPDAPAPAWVAVIDQDGRVVSVARFGPPKLMAAIYAAEPLADGGVALGGCADLTTLGTLHPWIVIVGADGKVRREIKRLRLDGGAVHALSAMPDGGLAAAGISGTGCGLMDGSTEGRESWLTLFPPVDIAPAAP